MYNIRERAQPLLGVIAFSALEIAAMNFLAPEHYGLTYGLTPTFALIGYVSGLGSMDYLYNKRLRR